MKTFMADPGKDLARLQLVMKRLYIEPREELLPVAGPCNYSQDSPPPTRLLKSFLQSRSRPGY